MLHTSKQIQEIVWQYWVKAFNISRLLHPFIALEDIHSFQQVLHVTDGIISKSAALQFLDRCTFNTSSDLDIYVHYQKAPIIKEWFIAHALHKIAYDTEVGGKRTIQGMDFVGDYHGICEVEDIINFKIPNTSRIILIMTKQDPTFAVLSFHSCKDFIPVHLYLT